MLLVLQVILKNRAAVEHRPRMWQVVSDSDEDAEPKKAEAAPSPKHAGHKHDHHHHRKHDEDKASPRALPRCDAPLCS